MEAKEETRRVTQRNRVLSRTAHEFPYEGSLGRTRLEAVHLTSSGGWVRSISMHRGINVATDPELQDRVLSGTLHQLETGEKLALSFTYHDPVSRKFVLVVPDALVHEELKERARLYSALAEETTYAIPGYVRDFATVIGIAGLRKYIGVGSEELEASADLVTLVQEPDPDLNRIAEELEALRVGLVRREENLTLAIHTLAEREATLLAREQQDEMTQEPMPALLLGSEVVEDDGEDDDDVMEVDMASVVEFTASESDTDKQRTDRRASLNPPTEFWKGSDQAIAAVVGKEVSLFIRLDEGRESAFQHQEATVLAQLLVVDGYPAIILCAIDFLGGGRPYVRRAALDPFKPEHQEVLQQLKREFALNLVLFAPHGDLVHAVRVRAPRETNVSLILDRVPTQPPEGIDSAIVLERALTAPPPITTPPPFATSDEHVDETILPNEAKAEIAKIVEWVTKEKRDTALLVLSVPTNILEASFRRALKLAIRFGWAVPMELIQHCSAFDGEEPSSVVTKLVRAFSSSASTENPAGIAPNEIAKNWKELMALAEAFHVVLDPEIIEMAKDSDEKLRTEGGVAGDAKARAQESS